MLKYLTVIQKRFCDFIFISSTKFFKFNYNYFLNISISSFISYNYNIKINLCRYCLRAKLQRYSPFFPRCLSSIFSSRRNCTTLSRLFTENRVFRFCVAYAFLYGTLRRGKGNLSRSQTTARNRAKIRQSSRHRVGFTGRMSACCLFAFEVRTIRGSLVFVFREARRDPRSRVLCLQECQLVPLQQWRGKLYSLSRERRERRG